MKLITFIFVILLVIFSCKKDIGYPPKEISETILPDKNIQTYLHISHTRLDSNPNMDNIIEHINYAKYNILLLGGDLAHLTSFDDIVMSHVDSIFNLSNYNTLWALGNHDYSDLIKVKQYTARDIYYAYYKNNITFVVLDTQDSLSNIIGAQKTFLNSVLDTIQKSSHLIILHHKLIWMYGNTILEPQIASVSNGGFGNCFYCLNPNNFNSEFYPKLKTLKQNGVNVICIGGDIGFLTKEFEYTTPDGIHFLASGIAAGTNGNKALLITHDLTNNQLSWEFKSISSL